MSPPGVVLPARYLGFSHYRLVVEEPAAVAGHPRDIRLEPYDDAPPAQVASLAAATFAAPRRWSVVIRLAASGRHGLAALRYRLSAAGRPGWDADIMLDGGQLEEPGPALSVPPQRLVQPEVDYTARDFDALRTLILTAVTRRVGAHATQLAVDEIVALVEEMAYLGDDLSYYEDAIATEAYLSTARRRISVTRHAALLDYTVGQGRSARTWVRVQPAGGVTGAFRLPKGTKLLTSVEAMGSRVDSRELPRALAAQPLVFETVSEVTVAPEDQSVLELDPVSHPGRRLRPGATSVTVLAPHDPVEPGDLMLVASKAGLPSLVSAPDVAGSVVRVQQVEHLARRRVRLTWTDDDAPKAGGLPPGEMCLLKGNLVIADHGNTQPWRPLPPPVRGVTYWPPLPAPGTAFTAGPGTEPAGPRPTADGAGYPSAAGELSPPQARLLPAVRVCELGPDLREWTVRRSLLESGPLALDFVVEAEEDGDARLRFGDNTNGMRPQAGAALRVCQRIGGGVAGNVAAGSLRHVCTDDARVAGIVQPVAARGGAGPEPLASARQHAPERFRINQRAVLARDYAQLALTLFPEVTDAAAELTSDGTAPLAVVHIHTGTWPSAEPGLVARVHAELQLRQPLGTGLRVLQAVACPADIALEVTPEPGAEIAAVGQQIDDALQRDLLAPGRFGFGVSLPRSTVIALVAALPGVEDVTCPRFSFTGEDPERRRDVLIPAPGQILRLDNDVRAPGSGRVTYRLRGVR